MTARITLALLFIVPAAMSYPWESTYDRWVLGIAAAAVLILFAWWRGAFLTTIVARRFGVFRRNHSRGRRAPASRSTVLLRVDPESATQQPPLDVIAGYLDRYGLRADAVRITSTSGDVVDGGDECGSSAGRNVCANRLHDVSCVLLAAHSRCPFIKKAGSPVGFRDSSVAQRQ